MIKNKIKWKYLLTVSIIFILFLAFILPQVDNYSSRIMGEGKSPDTSLIYSADNLYDMAQGYGESGREAYIKLRWTFDVIWPIVYSLFLVLWLIKLSAYINTNNFLKHLFILPLVGMGFDFLENIGATIIMIRYPLKSGIIANITPIMTFLKWVTLSASILIFLALIVLSIARKIKENRKS